VRERGCRCPAFPPQSSGRQVPKERRSAWRCGRRPKAVGWATLPRETRPPIFAGSACPPCTKADINSRFGGLQPLEVFQGTVRGKHLERHAVGRQDSGVRRGIPLKAAARRTARNNEGARRSGADEPEDGEKAERSDEEHDHHGHRRVEPEPSRREPTPAGEEQISWGLPWADAGRGDAMSYQYPVGLFNHFASDLAEGRPQRGRLQRNEPHRPAAVP